MFLQYKGGLGEFFPHICICTCTCVYSICYKCNLFLCRSLAICEFIRVAERERELLELHNRWKTGQQYNVLTNQYKGTVSNYIQGFIWPKNLGGGEAWEKLE